MIRPVNSATSQYIEWNAGAAFNAGQLMVLSGADAVPAAEAVSSQVILGVAVNSGAATDVVLLYPPDQEFEFDIYQGSSVDEGTAAMKGVLYDLYVDGAAGDAAKEGEMYIDLNDTTGAFIRLSSYDNGRRVAYGRFPTTLIII